MKTLLETDIADKIANDVINNQKPKRLKIRTLLKHFNYVKRTEDNTTRITQLLDERNILISPTIIRLGDTWQLSFDDQVYLSEKTLTNTINTNSNEVIDIYDYQSDTWFDMIQDKNYRTEKEVENKFIIPLLSRLGFNEDDRYDEMPISVSHGSKPTVLEVDFALFNADNEELNEQVLLVVEAKKEKRLLKQVELEKAQRQVKSYGIWLSCRYGLVTDGTTIQVIDIISIKTEGTLLFECNRKELKDRFEELYRLVGKTELTKKYEKTRY